MRFTFYSFIMAFLWSNLFLLTLCVCRRSSSFVKAVGFPPLAAAFLLCLVRTFVPLEFDNVAIVPSYQIYTYFINVLKEPIPAVFSRQITLVQFLGLLWASGSLLLTIRLTWQYRRAMVFLERSSIPYEAALPRFRQLLRDYRIKSRRVRFRICPALEVPMVSGFLTHTIYIPDCNSSEEALTHIVLHELAHIRHHDAWMKLLADLYYLAFWWNPLAYLLKNNLEQALEVRCDGYVTKSFSTGEKLAYLSTLLANMKTAKADRRNAVPYASAQLSSKKSAAYVKQRFQLVLEGRRPSRKNRVLQIVWSLALLLCFVGSYTFIFQPYYSPPQEEIVGQDSIHVESNSSYIIQATDGVFYLYTENSEPICIIEKTARQMEKSGYLIYH